MTHPDGAPRPYDHTRDYVQEARDRWQFRRLMVFAAAGVLALLLMVLARTGQSEMYGQTVWAFVVLVMTYIGGPIADDYLQTRVLGRRA